MPDQPDSFLGQNVDKVKAVAIVYLDFSNAFDIIFSLTN